MAKDIMPIGIGSTRGVAAGVAKAAKTAAGGLGSFTDTLANLVDNVEESQADANEAVVDMLDKKTEVHDAMIALQRAEMSLQFTIQVRNKLVQAYQDMMRMPV
jgi:flagellar hook-basal body complex protein FliE